VLSRGPGDALVDMAVRLFGAETVSLGGVQASNTLGHGPKEGIPSVSSRGRGWPRRVKSVPSIDAREKSEVKVVPVSVSACIS
jgi:hypothetical protein